MRGFWNDADGITVIDVLALLFGLTAIIMYCITGTMDTNFADICIGALLCAAGQKMGAGYLRGRIESREGSPGTPP